MLFEEMKKKAAEAALEFVEKNMIIGVGTGSTVNYFIDALKNIRHKFDGAVPSSKVTAERLKSIGIPVYDLNTVNDIPIYIDGVDEINPYFQMMKGGGGALTGEKIIAAVAKKFICITDQRKKVKQLGQFPVAIEVIPLARSYVAREIVKLGGNPVYRQGFRTDYDNIILDVHNLNISEPIQLEKTLNNIVGVVTNGLFAERPADVLLMGYDDEQGKIAVKREDREI